MSQTLKSEGEGQESLSRRMVTVVYADVANYSGLCAIDEEGTHHKLERYLDIFTKAVEVHDGHVHHYAGDAILASFPGPVNALACAVEVQTTLLELNKVVPAGLRVEFRVGINEGRVIAKRGDLFGDDVNIAARLESLSTPGGICVSQPIMRAVNESGLDVSVSYLGERRLKNISRPISAYLLEIGEPDQKPAKQFRTRTGAWLQLPERPSLAVLPFKYSDSDPVAKRFAGGLTMEVTTELIRLSGLFLASDFSTLRYRREEPSDLAVSRDLGVRYLLRGSVLHSDGRIRVHAELVDGINGISVWAERYDDNLDDAFEIQDLITDSIISALDVKLVSGARSHVTRQSLRNRASLHRYYSGWSHLVTGTRESLMLAQREFEAASELEPESPLPLAMASWTYWWVGFRALATDAASAFTHAEHLARRAQSLEDPTGFSSLVMAHLHLVRREYQQALESATFALNLRPSCDVSAATFASVLNYLGRSEEAIHHAEQAIRLTPVAPTIYPGILATSYYGAGHYEEAIAAAQTLIGFSEDAIDAWLVLAVSEVALGNEAAAQRAMVCAKRVKPDLQLDAYLETQPYEEKERIDDLRSRLSLAGLT